MAEVERHRAQIAEKHELSESWIIERLKHEAQHAESDGARVSALNTLAKTRGMLLDKQQIQQVESCVDEIKRAREERGENVVRLKKNTG